MSVCPAVTVATAESMMPQVKGVDERVLAAGGVPVLRLGGGATRQSRSPSSGAATARMVFGQGRAGRRVTGPIAATTLRRRLRWGAVCFGISQDVRKLRGAIEYEFVLRWQANSYLSNRANGCAFQFEFRFLCNRFVGRDDSLYSGSVSRHSMVRS